MNDNGVSVLEQYGMEQAEIRRTRGALLCRNGQELYILRPFAGTEKKLEKEQELLTRIQEESGCKVDCYLENKEGGIYSTDKEGDRYTLQRWYDGRECDTKSREDLSKSISVLARIHKCMKLPGDITDPVRSLAEEYRRHNQELQKIRKFIRKKGAENEFEKMFVKSFSFMAEKGKEAEMFLNESDYDKLKKNVIQEGLVCHGDFNQHNVLMTRFEPAITGFHHWNYDIQIVDLYHFLRKIMEKNHWDDKLCSILLREYEKHRILSTEEKENLAIRFSYPEKYWKLANYYFSHNKVWISGKNIEKLQVLLEQNKKWENFVKKCKNGDIF